MKKVILCIFFLPACCIAQSVLKTSIGVSSIPADIAAVCSIPLYTGSFDSSGLQVADTAFDFKLFTMSGDSFSLSEKLSHGKPVLLIAGSYTCPVFRNKITKINSIAATYLGQIEIAIVYTLEAHPTVVSPYFGYVNVTQANQTAGILYDQPATYAERKAICGDMLQSLSLNVPVYLDGPCNNWWNTYGPAPNNAYLIDTNGIVFAKHGWFDRHPDHDIVCDIDSLLGVGSCNIIPATGAFILEPVSSTVSGLPGEVLYAHINVINTTGSYVNIGVKKIQPNLPAGWETAFCFQVCFSPSEDTITIEVAPYDTADFSLDFFTSAAIRDSGSMKVGFRNINDLNNAYSLTFRGFTIEPTTALADIVVNDNDFTLFPNPASGDLQIQLNQSAGERIAEIFDGSGNMLYRQALSNSLNTLPVMKQFAIGTYYIRVGNTVKAWMKQ